MIPKGYTYRGVDGLRSLPIDAECYFQPPMQMTVNLTVKMLFAETSSIRDNGLQMPLMIEWA